MRGKLIHPLREAMGRELFREHPVEADLVIGVPDSATAAANGYAKEADIPYGEGFGEESVCGPYLHPARSEATRYGGISET